VSWILMAFTVIEQVKSASDILIRWN